MPPENNAKVEFDGEIKDEQRQRKILYSRVEPSSIEPQLIRFLIRKHIIKSERQGDILLVGIFFLFIILSIFIYEHSSKSSRVNVTTETVLKAISR